MAERKDPAADAVKERSEAAAEESQDDLVEPRSALTVLKEKGAYAPSFTPSNVIDVELIFTGAEFRTNEDKEGKDTSFFNVTATRVDTGEAIELRCGTKRMRGYFAALQDEFPVAGKFVKIGTRSIDLQ